MFQPEIPSSFHDSRLPPRSVKKNAIIGQPLLLEGVRVVTLGNAEFRALTTFEMSGGRLRAMVVNILENNSRSYQYYVSSDAPVDPLMRMVALTCHTRRLDILEQHLESTDRVVRHADILGKNDLAKFVAYHDSASSTKQYLPASVGTLDEFTARLKLLPYISHANPPPYSGVKPIYTSVQLPIDKIEGGFNPAKKTWGDYPNEVLKAYQLAQLVSQSNCYGLFDYCPLIVYCEDGITFNLDVSDVEVTALKGILTSDPYQISVVQSDVPYRGSRSTLLG